MDMFAFRALERLIAVIIGGMAIYLGYRLFLTIQAGGGGSARVSLPGDVTIMISRVGPGVFFALFGTIVVAASLYYAIKYNETAQATREGTIYTRELTGIGPAANTTAREGQGATGLSASQGQTLELDRVRLRQEIEFLNRVPGLLTPELNQGQRQETARHLREIKLRLMRTVWASDWGDPGAFRIWAEGGPKAENGETFRKAHVFYAAGEEHAQ